MKTITFYSYKGGVGRSLALANVANRLSEFGKKVCIIDFDLEAPGMHLKFDRFINGQVVKKGLVDYIDDFTSSLNVPKNIADFVTKIDFQNLNRQNIDLIAAGNTQSKDYWKKLSCINWKSLFYEEDSYGVDFFLNMKEQIRAQLKPDVLLIDSRTGITDISGITMSILADEVVLLAANNRENLEGVSQVANTLSDPSNSFGDISPKINFVLTRIPFFPNAKDKPLENNAKNAAIRIINSKLNEQNKIRKIGVIHSDPELELKEQFKISYNAAYKNDVSETPIGLDYLQLFEELTIDMLSEKEKETFETFVNVESLIEKASTSDNFNEQISLLNTALELSPTSGLAHLELAKVYQHFKDYNQSLLHLQEARKYNPELEFTIMLHESFSYEKLKHYDTGIHLTQQLLNFLPKSDILKTNLARLYYHKGQYQEAFDILKNIITEGTDDADTWNLYSVTLRHLDKLEDAFDAIYQALELDPQSATATGTLAEIYASQGNEREFYKNLELSFSFGIDSFIFQEILLEEDIYIRYFNDPKFSSILEKYNIEVDYPLVVKTWKGRGYNLTHEN